MIDDWTKVLQYHVATMVDNEIPNLAPSVHRSGRSLKSIRQRLKGKEGRIRNNLMGKRVDTQINTSVITPDPNIELDELGVPYDIAKNLTYPGKVNKYNINMLKRLLENGYNNYPGVKSIIKTDETKISVTENNILNIELEYGDIVNRNLIDGDYVLFNRQPSLHKMSMMAHRVKVMPGNTFRLNVSVTPPYNADFDGDEMNMHVPQSIAGDELELMNIASVNYQIISPRENKPIITVVQDTLLGINKLTNSEIINYINPTNDTYLLTNNRQFYNIEKVNNGEKIQSKIENSTYLNKSQLMNIISQLSTYDGSIPEPDNIINNNNNIIEYWSGKQLISYILPKSLNLKMKNNAFDNNPNKNINEIVIKNGKLIKGTLDKSCFTKTSKGLIHTIYNDFGPIRTKNFIDDLQKIITEYLLIEGFSMGVGDIIADKDTYNKIREIIEEKKE